MDGKCAEHIARGESIKRLDKRMEETETKVDKLSECLTQLTALQQGYEWRFKENEKRIHDNDNRLRELEKAKGLRYDQVWGYLVVAVISALMGYLTTHLPLG